MVSPELEAYDLPRGENPGQLHCGDFFQLVVAAGARVLVRAPALEVRGVAEAVALQVIVSDLADARGAERLPAQVLAAVPAAGGARHALVAFLRASPVAPGMVLERVLAQRRELLHQLAALRGGEAGRDADVVQRALVVVQAEEQRADQGAGT